MIDRNREDEHEIQRRRRSDQKSDREAALALNEKEA